MARNRKVGGIHRVRNRLVKGGVFSLLTLLAIATLYPVVFVVFSTFKTDTQFAIDPIGPPHSLYFGNFLAAWQIGLKYFGHSAIVVAISVICILTAATLAAFSLAHLNPPFPRVQLTIFIGLLIQPAALLLLPIFLVIHNLDLVNNYLGLALVYCGLGLPFAIYMMYSYFQGLSHDIIDAAYVDGASNFRLLLEIALPLARPALVTLGTLMFIWLWGEYLFALLILQTDSTETAIVGLMANLVPTIYGQSPTLLLAGTLISILPPIAVFVIFNRGLTQGLQAGAVRG